MPPGRSNTGIYQQWGASKHYRANIWLCFECHMAAKNDPDGYAHGKTHRHGCFAQGLRPVPQRQTADSPNRIT